MKRLIFISFRLLGKFYLPGTSICLLSIAFCIGMALAPSPAEGQTTYNLQIIFQRGAPDTSLRYWGGAIAGVGDVNGDGFDDVAVGAYIDISDPNMDTAKVYIYYGSASGIDTTADLLISDWSSGSGGLNVCGGDINKDGFSDIMVCAAGKIYIHFGGSPPSQNADIVFGYGTNRVFDCVATGDLNGDDTLDLIVGDYFSYSGNGCVYIFKGAASFDTIPWVVLRGKGGEEFGYSISASGDVNNDGYEDLAVGAINYGADCRGRLYVFNGGSLMDTIPDMWKDGEGPNQSWGWMNVAIMPNGKGYGKAGIGCCLWPSGFMSENRGKTLIFDGGAVMDSFPDAIMLGQNDSSALGYWNAWVGDVDTNKYGDWGSLASNDSMGLLWRCNITTDTIADAWLKYIKPGLLANAGDVNGDGRDEVMFASNADTNRLVVICKYTGPDGVTEKPFETVSTSGLKLFENVPNPFRQRTTIKYQISQGGRVSLKVYNITGQLVKTLVDLSPGPSPNEFGEGRLRSVVWDCRDERGQKVTNGVYIYKLSLNGETMVKKMTLIR